MNRQPYTVPYRRWSPKLKPHVVQWSRRLRDRTLRRSQQLVSIESLGLDHLTSAVQDGCGVMITANHAAHYDWAALYAVADRVQQPLYFLTAWQVFAMSNRFHRWLMPRIGCYSIDRESTDRDAFRESVRVLCHEPHPLVIFPEGEVYHVNDRPTPFRSGAAAMARTAARRNVRPILMVPCAIKFWYVDDPTQSLLTMLDRCEARFDVASPTSLPLIDRVYRLGEVLLSMKEEYYLGHRRSGSIRNRMARLSEAILSRLERHYAHVTTTSSRPGDILDQVQRLRHYIIERQRFEIDVRRRQSMDRDLDDLFFVVQLYSYPNHYLRQRPTIERVAETIDKLEEDIFETEVPTVHGRRRVIVSFGEPIRVPSNENTSADCVRLTQECADRVQAMLDELNANTTPAFVH